jgi:hypothetical protein
VSSADKNVLFLFAAVSRIGSMPMLDHLTVFRPANVNHGFAAQGGRKVVCEAAYDDPDRICINRQRPITLRCVRFSWHSWDGQLLRRTI